MTKETKHYQTYKVEDMNIHRDVTSSFNYNQSGPPEITIFVAPANSTIYDTHGAEVGESTFGHTFIGIKGINPVTKNYEIITVGLSTGESLKISTDNLSFKDHIYYKDASTISIMSQNMKFYNDFNNLFTVLHNYKTGNTEPPPYNLLSNNCGQFVEDMLSEADIDNINIPYFPDNLYENLENVADNYCTPLIIDLNGDGVKTITDNMGVTFDFNNDGELIRTGWVHPEDGLLVMDRDKNGIISNGNELFGEHSPVLSFNINDKNGFSSLSSLDSNCDGLINQDDISWSELLVWKDNSMDGISQSDELFSLETIGISSIGIDAQRSFFYDENGNFHKLTANVDWVNGNKTDITDVLFHEYNENNDSLNNSVLNINEDTSEYNNHPEHSSYEDIYQYISYI